jgi:hypothetical protein
LCHGRFIYIGFQSRDIQKMTSLSRRFSLSRP